MVKFIHAEMTHKHVSETSYLTVYFMFLVFSDEHWICLSKKMFAYNITGLLHTAYELYVYCVPSKKLNTAY